MGNELKLNSAEEAEVVLIRLTPEEYPIAYANKVKCLMLSGLSKKEAERMAMEPIDLELYYEGDRELAALYDRLWREADEYAMNNFKGEELDYYYRITD